MVPGAPVRRLALLVEYEGTGFGGSQYQKKAGTIQAALERALSSLTGEPIRVALAGRTDAGVHARGQVAAFSTRSRHSPDVFLRALNHHLPDQIAVRAVREVRPDFDPRRRASARWYRYTVYNGRQRAAPLPRVGWQGGGAAGGGGERAGGGAPPRGSWGWCGGRLGGGRPIARPRPEGSA